MSDEADTKQDRERPDLVRNYRPVAIRSVVAAHAMIPKTQPQPISEPPSSGMGFTLPAGFHSPPED